MEERKVISEHTIMSPGVCDEVLHNKEFKHFVMRCLNRHMSGDWGDVTAEDASANDFNLQKNDGRLTSYYTGNDLCKDICIVTNPLYRKTFIVFP